LTHLPSRFKVELFILTDDPFDQERFARRVRVSVGGRQAVFSAAEDAVVQKLLWFLRSGDHKHRKDVRDMLAAQGSSLDWEYVRSWADKHGTRALLDEIAAELDQ
ncbi:MAG: hypothetical protein JSU68_06875, partial [Phycisphaerales bacterium]